MKKIFYLLLIVSFISACNEKPENMVTPDQALATTVDFSTIAKANLQSTANQEAYLNKQLDLLDLSEHEIEKASKNASNNFISLKDSYKKLNNLGNQLFDEESYHLALFHYITSLQLSIFNGELEGQAIAFRNVALAYQQVGDYENAAINFWQSFYLWEKIGNESRKGQLYNDLGVVYALAHDFVPVTSFDVENSTALSFYDAALDLHHATNNAEKIAQVAYNIDVLYTTWLEKERSSIFKKGWRYEQDDVEDIL